MSRLMFSVPVPVTASPLPLVPLAAMMVVYQAVAVGQLDVVRRAPDKKAKRNEEGTSVEWRRDSRDRMDVTETETTFRKGI